jgi:hypothetical protein
MSDTALPPKQPLSQPPTTNIVNNSPSSEPTPREVTSSSTSGPTTSNTSQVYHL